MFIAPTARRIARAVLLRPPTCGRVRVVAVDGGAAAGKSSLASALHAQFWISGLRAELISTDDLLDGWDGQFTFWPRLRDGVLVPLAAGRSGRYRHFDWEAGRFAGTLPVPADPDVLIVEGVSAIAACAPYVTYGLLVDVPRRRRELRWLARDGAVALPPAWERWLDAEDEFFRSEPPAADLRWTADHIPDEGPDQPRPTRFSEQRERTPGEGRAPA